MLGFHHAFRGLFNLVKTERNFKIQLLVLFLVILLGFFFQITTTEWIFVIFSSIIVLSLEALNSSVEKLADEVSLEQNPKIKWIKDVSAASVLISALGTAIVGCIIFLPYIIKLVV
ncbi:MAG: diacylglycerol kinase [Fluviicola sp.]|nr:MAG: diacylglycerol kinase [Fluviicola sp.]